MHDQRSPRDASLRDISYGSNQQEAQDRRALPAPVLGECRRWSSDVPIRTALHFERYESVCW
jgi:hypothetical protein